MLSLTTKVAARAFAACDNCNAPVQSKLVPAPARGRATAELASRALAFPATGGKHAAWRPTQSPVVLVWPAASKVLRLRPHAHRSAGDARRLMTDLRTQNKVLEGELEDANARNGLMDKQLQRVKSYLANTREGAEAAQMRAAAAESKVGWGGGGGGGEQQPQGWPQRASWVSCPTVNCDNSMLHRQHGHAVPQRVKQLPAMFWRQARPAAEEHG